jgi:hypothetical protein
MLGSPKTVNGGADEQDRIQGHAGLQYHVIPGEDGVRVANSFDPDGNPLTLAQPNQPASAGK